MKAKFSIALTLTLLFLLVVSNISLAQIMFTDVDEGHWAKEYVEDVVNLGLMQGYNDGTFRPSEKVNKAQALTMICSLMGPTEEELKVARSEKNSFVNQYPLSESGKDLMAYGLSKGIVNEKVISSVYFKDGKVADAEKLEVSIYLVRAMGLEEEAKNRGSALLFKDAELISIDARSYVDILIKKKIVDGNGDSQGKFNPSQVITRGAMAKMLSLANADMVKNPNTHVEPSVPGVPEEPIIEQPPIEDPEIVQLPEEPNVKLEENQMLGNIVAKAGDFIIIESVDKKDSYKVTPTTTITVNGNISNKENLEKGMTVKITVEAGNILSKVESESTNEILTGTIVKVNLGTNPSIKLKDDDNMVKTVYLTNETNITVNGSKAQFFTLKEGDRAKVEVLNNLGNKVAVECLNGNLRGTIVEKVMEDGYTVVLEREDSSTHEYVLDEAVKIIRNGSQGDFNHLRRKDVVNVVLVNGLVTDVDARSVSGEDEGYIKAILISEEPQVTIVRENKEVENYYISKSAFIKVDGKIMDIYSLRLGQYGKVRLESDEIVELNIDIKREN